jgi:hypothetical protein
MVKPWRGLLIYDQASFSQRECMDQEHDCANHMCFDLALERNPVEDDLADAPALREAVLVVKRVEGWAIRTSTMVRTTAKAEMIQLPVITCQNMAVDSIGTDQVCARAS